MKQGKYAKTLAKILVAAIFLMQDMRINFLPKFIEICMETPCWCPSVWAPTWRSETNLVPRFSHLTAPWSERGETLVGSGPVPL